ncbi:PilT/PilU family type 4a pilus ATPase [Candidatus Microgenomates bacterium]|nr:PilT/PilU family type 4a pilus ATPase [Candidatus Microgenomates bacterium]
MDIPHLTDDKPEIFELLLLGLERKASDLHLSAGHPPILRIDGKLLPVLERPRLTPGYIEKLVGLLLTDDQKKILKEKKELDFSYIFRDQAFLRANAFYQKNSIACIIRLIPSQIRDFESLSLPPSVKKFATYNQGLVLVTGPAGSGKSTTIASIIDEINRTKSEHILTIEDPIEYVFSPKKSVINQREVGRDTNSFSDALKAALREDFNVILIGELRDAESIETALTIAETGHLVFATIHAGSAVATPDRVVNAFPPHYQTQIRSQLSNVLLGVIGQRLVPKIDNGRIPAVEIMMVNQAIANSIKEGKTAQIKSIVETSRSEGMVTFEQSLSALLADKKINEDALRGLI